MMEGMIKERCSFRGPSWFRALLESIILRVRGFRDVSLMPKQAFEIPFDGRSRPWFRYADAHLASAMVSRRVCDITCANTTSSRGHESSVHQVCGCISFSRQVGDRGIHLCATTCAFVCTSTSSATLPLLGSPLRSSSAPSQGFSFPDRLRPTPSMGRVV